MMKKIVVLIPCYNEAVTINRVIKDFKKYLPFADIYVYDNMSNDKTADIARKSGAIVRFVNNRGKGNVVKNMFADIDADIYVMVDGDATYNASDVLNMINTFERNKVDMVIGVRKEQSINAYRGLHKIGNKIFNKILALLFNSNFNDIFSGYRVFSKRFVKTFPVMSKGFDIEAELSIHALMLSIPCCEVETAYIERPKNSHSKLRTFADGSKILFSIINSFMEARPLCFFSIITLCLMLLSFIFLPIAFISMSFFSFICGIILDSVSQCRLELKKLHYLMYKNN